MTLSECAQWTDKGPKHHHYTEVYEQYLSKWKNDEFHLVEVGVEHGGSLRMWEQYFPNASITGIEIDPKYAVHARPPRTEVIVDSATFADPWNKVCLRGRPRLIVDDGSHLSRDMILTFELAWYRLERGGIYVVEDTLWCNALDEAAPAKPSLSGLNYFANLAQVMNSTIPPQTMDRIYCANPEFSDTDIAWIHFYRSLVIIGKKP